jgi:hypothetical protein
MNIKILRKIKHFLIQFIKRILLISSLIIIRIEFKMFRIKLIFIFNIFVMTKKLSLNSGTIRKNYNF